MKRTYFLLVIIFLICCCLSACQKDNGGSNSVANTPQGLLVGKWTLQQQKYTQYVDGAKDPDMTFTTSASDMAYVQFDKNGNYTSVTQLILGSPPAVFVARDTLAGSYKLLGNTFTLSSGFVSSLYVISATASYTPATETAVINPISNSVQISQLTSNMLTLHFEIVVNYHFSTGVITNYKTVSDLYYTR
jgi:hypothetical protein